MLSTPRARADGRRSQLVAAGLFLLLFTSAGILYTLGAAVGSALFISSLPPAKVPSTVPWVYVGASVANVATALVYDRLLARLSRMAALLLTQLSLATLFSGSMLLWVREAPSHYYVLTIGLDAASLLSLTLFFGFAGDYFSPREARRLYGLIAGGLAVGTVIGGEALSVLVPRFGVPNMVHACALVLGFNAGLCVLIARVSTPVQVAQPPTGEQTVSLRVLIGNPFVRLIWLTFVLGMVLTVASAFQMQWIASGMKRAELAAFFGRFYAWVGGVELLVQFLVVPWLLRSLGVVGSLLLPPVLVAGASAVMQSAAAVSYLGGSALGYSAAVNGIRLTLEETLTLPARELLFLPLSARIRARAQTFAGAVLAPLTRGISGGLLLVYVGAGLRLDSLSMVVVLCSLALFVTTLRLRAQYRNALFESLRASGLGGEDLARALEEKGAEVVVSDLLRSEDARVIAFTLELIGERQAPTLIPFIKPLVAHGSHEVASRALAFLGAQRDPQLREAIEPSLDASEIGVASAAILALARVSEEAARARLRPLLDDVRGEVADAAMRAFAPFDRDGEVERRLERMLAQDASARRRAISLIEGMALPRYGALLAPLLGSQVASERRAAARAAALCRSEALSGSLVDCARRGELAPADFAELGEAALGPIAQLLGAGIDALERRRLLLCISQVSHPDALALLLAEVTSSRETLTRAMAAECARKCSLAAPWLSDVRPQIEPLLEREALALSHLLDAQAAFASSSPEAALLFGDHAKAHVEVVLSLAGFYMSPQEHERMIASLASSSSTLRESALELLDAALPRRLAARIGTDVQRALAGTGEERKERLSQAQLEQLATLDPLTSAVLARALPKTDRWLADPDAQRVFDLLPDVLFLKRVALFSGLGADYVLELAAIAHPVRVGAGERLFERGDRGDALFVVCEGALSIEVEGRELARLGVGEPFGELALLDDEPRSAAVVAASKARLLRIPVDRFQALLAAEPSLRRALLFTLHGRLLGSRSGGAHVSTSASIAPPRHTQVGLRGLVSALSVLKETALFGELPQSTLLALAARARPTSQYAGEALYREGELAEALYVVCSGTFTELHAERPVREHTRGAVLGEDALIGHKPRPTGVITKEPGELLALRTAELRQLLDEHAELSLSALRYFAGRLRAETAQRVAE